jgi:hypothetical protein
VNRPATEPCLGADRHDAVLALALGALALSRSAEEALRRQAPAGSDGGTPEEPLVLAALGVISIGRSLARWLEEVADASPQPNADSRPGLDIRDLMR